VGFRPTSDSDSESNISNAEAQCANSATDWMRLNEEHNEAAKILHFRSRLTYLTGEPITPTDQRWDTEIREMSRQLQHALQDSADYIFSSGMQPTGDWKNVNALLWSTTCQLSNPSENRDILPIHFLMYRNNGRWKISEYQLEAAIGLWWWSLKMLPKASQVYKRKVMFAEERKKMDIKSAIQLWVAQADMSNERIQLLSPDSTDTSELHWSPTSQSGESYHPTSPSIPMTTSLDILDLKEDVSPTGTGDGVLALQSRSSPLQMIAQDIFTIFIGRIADIIEPLKDAVPRQSQFATMNPLGNSQERPYLGLMNTHIESIADKVVAAGIGARQDALMSIIPPLLQRAKLPQLDSVMEDLLSYAKSLRRDSKFQVGESLLKGLFHLGPSQFQERVTRALGEIYRAGIRSPNQQERDFGARGLEQMEKTCGIPEPSANVKEILNDYKSIWKHFKERSSTQGGQNPRTLDGDPEKLLEDLMNEPGKTRSLTLTEDIDLRKASSAYLLKILRWAIRLNSPELIEDLWTVKRTLIHETDGEGRTPIFWAIETGCKADTFQALLEWPTVRPDSHDKEGMTPFLLAAMHGHCKTIKFLLEQGADRLARHKGRTALMLACERDRYDAVKLLLDARVEVDARGGIFGSALSTAVYRGQTEIVKLLVKEGKADVNMKLQIEEYGSALETAILGIHTEIVKVLIQEGKANVNVPFNSETYGSALEAATDFQQTETVKFLVQRGKANVNIPFKSGNYGSALAAAAYRRETEIVKLLVQEGKADVNMQLRRGEYGSALAAAAAAAYIGEIEVVKFLVLEGKADVNMQLQSGKYGSALTTAAVFGGETDTVRFLVQEGRADVNMQLQRGEYGSALAAAAYFGRRECVELLIKAGAEVGLKLENGRFGSALKAAGATISEQDLGLFPWYTRDEETQRDKDEVRKLLELHQAASA
jgi:ankyrin repeat protein